LKLALAKSPTDNAGDAFIFACHKCLLVSEDLKVRIWGDRRWDIAVLAFNDMTDRESFLTLAEWRVMPSAREAREFMASVTEASPDFLEVFLRSYG
jgi:hypothetical protein